jgi:predicted transposase/invertase (TIGR01784 family)
VNKLPEEVAAGDMRLLWLSLFRADTEEELEAIGSMEVEVMGEAIRAYHQITADSEFREMERLREMARHNEAAALRHARDEGRVEGRVEIARNALAEGASPDFIQRITGLDIQTITNISKVKR